MTAEQRELTRLCAQRVISNHDAGRVVDLRTLAWARGFVACVMPLGQPLGAGIPDHELPEPLRGGALEVF
ncbi:MAG: hypothetical protein LC098_07715 [Burkholderiales bacterium]|nr:hypothetical protein [Burkholderiales bacterium]ODU07974.1 MAG: hypothetical protein ABS84_14790 [Rubrivivax sp. SCN 71-131]